MSERENGPGRGNRPVETLRDSALKLAIFRNRGDKGDFYSAVPGRIYTDENTGKVREVSSLSGPELLRMANLLTQGYGRIAELKELDRENTDRGRDGERDTARERDERARGDAYEQTDRQAARRQRTRGRDR